MRRFTRIAILLISCMAFTTGGSEFKEQQLKNAKVKEAFEWYEVDLQTKLLLKGIRKQGLQIYIRTFKMEETVEVWAKNKSDKTFQLIADYKFCNNVGRLGPKRRQGDKQIPEGYYSIEKFNPNSNHHLSLKVNYPNRSDSIKGEKGNYGGQIFLHGGCATIGCIPITDSMISELYVLAVMAKDAGQEEIPVHMFPARLNEANLRSLRKSDYPEEIKLFWENMVQGYRYFEQYGYPPVVQIAYDGKYIYRKN